MSVLHHMVPILMFIQFIVVLVAVVAAMLLADPQCSLPARKSSRPPLRQFVSASRG
jgi:hypothetical protein